MDPDKRGAGLRAGESRTALGGLTTERAVALLILAALLILVVSRGAFRGALGD